MLTRSSFLVARGVLAAAVVLVLSACGGPRAGLPPFPDYPPAKVYLEEQERLRERVSAIEAHEAEARLQNQLRATRRAEEMWRRLAALRAQQERELAFRETLRRLNQERHFRELQEFQALQ